MANLTFADSHNIVAYMEKSAENTDFVEIVDFLNANPIKYALTVSLTIYVSYIEQFWSTAKTKTINNKTQIHAKVDGKTIVIIESSVKSDLQFNDEDDEIDYEERGDKVERAATNAASLDVEQDSGTINKTQSTVIPNEPIPQGTGSGGSPRRQDTYWGTDLLILGLRGCLNSPMNHLSQELTHMEVGRTVGKEEKVKNSTPQEEGRNDLDERISFVQDAEIQRSTAEPSTPPTTTTTVIEDEDLIIA
nr:hypothetical protein [Tanacetum cinerariifolium]